MEPKKRGGKGKRSFTVSLEKRKVLFYTEEAKN